MCDFLLVVPESELELSSGCTLCQSLVSLRTSDDGVLERWSFAPESDPSAVEAFAGG